MLGLKRRRVWHVPITDEQIRAVREQAARRKDSRQVSVCDIALGVKRVSGDPTENRRKARALCLVALRKAPAR